MLKHKKDLVLVWVTIGILASSIIGYIVYLKQSNQRAFGETSTPYTLMLIMVMIWITTTMLIAYGRWKKSNRDFALLSDVFSGSGDDVVTVIDKHKTIVTSNDAMLPVFGYQKGEVVEREINMLFKDHSLNFGETEDAKDSIRRLGFYRDEIQGTKRDGSNMHMEATIARRKQEEGFVLYLRDITERKEADQLIQKAKAELEVANDEKTEALNKLEESYKRLRELETHRDSLVHMVCHDMRAPIQVLMLQLDLLKALVIEKLDANEMESVDTLLLYTRQLEIMVNSMLDVSKLETGEFPLHPKVGNLRNTITSSLNFIRGISGTTSLNFNAPAADREFRFDNEIIDRILTNLLFNALKYVGQNGTVTVNLVYKEEYARIEVSDNGPGIPLEYKDTIFDKFIQVKGESHSKPNSTGLGLTFCKLATESHGGTIGVDSDLGQGSTFWFTLPYVLVQESEAVTV